MSEDANRHEERRRFARDEGATPVDDERGRLWLRLLGEDRSTKGEYTDRREDDVKPSRYLKTKGQRATIVSRC
jgi:hypothetical protein